MKKVIVWHRKEKYGNVGAGQKALASFAKGIMKCGDELSCRDPQHQFSRMAAANADVNIMFGVTCFNNPEILQISRANNIPFIIMERGFFQRRERGGDWYNSYWSIGWRGKCGDADYKNAKMPDDRWKQLGIEIKPYKKDGAIVVCGHWPTDSWPFDVVKELRKHTKKRIIVRPHPERNFNATVPGAFISRPPRTRQDDLKEAYAVVVHNSSICFEALVNGVHVIQWPTGKCGAYTIAHSDISQIGKLEEKEREQFFHNLAYAQWNCEEMESGEAWKHLNGENQYQLPDTDGKENYTNFKYETAAENPTLAKMVGDPIPAIPAQPKSIIEELKADYKENENE